MHMSYGASAFYLIALLFAMTGIYKIKKSDNILPGGTWLPVSVLIVALYQCFVAALICLIHIPVNIISIGIFDLLLGGGLWFYIVKKSYIQSYKYQKIDIISWIVIFVIVLLFALQRYGLDLHIHYQTIDPAQHLKSAMDIVNGQSVYAMYFAGLHNALLIELLGPFRQLTRYYQIFVLSDILQLYLAGVMFYGIIRKYITDKYMAFVAPIGTLIYLLAYPLNNTIFGFVYLGMCVTIIGYLLITVDAFINGNLYKWPGVIMISLGCLGVFECYVLFMPVVFFSILFCVLWKQHNEKKLVSFDTIKICLGIFLIPTLLGLGYTYMGIFGSGGTSVGSAIANEGGIYRDLFSNYILLLPFVFYGLYRLCKEKKNKIVIYMFVLTAVFMFAFFLLGMKGKASSYYFYKNYYMMWLLCFVLAVKGIHNITKENRKLLTLGFLTWFFVATISITNIEVVIQNINPLYCTNTNARAYSDIYTFNRDAMRNPAYDMEKVKLYDYAVEQLGASQTEKIPLAGYWEDYYWMEAITNQRMSGFDYWNIGEEMFFDNLSRVDYVIVLTDSDIYAANKEYFDSLEPIFETSSGYIAKVR